MLQFATHTGFDGSDQDWQTEFGLLAKECNSPQGIPLREFERLANDKSDDGCYCSDDELRSLLAKVSIAHPTANAASETRRTLIHAVFVALNKNGLGMLSENEMRVFAVHAGFDGSDEEWLDVPGFGGSQRELNEAGRQIIDEDFWHRIFQEIESSPAESYNLRPNASTMKERQGSRGLKNFNNLVKDVLICWAVQQVAAPASAVHVLDVASGRGGDQMKFGKAAAAANRRLCYTAIDVAEAQILEAQRRMIASRQKDDAPSLESARFLIGDVAKIAPSTFAQQLALQHISSVQFAVHYAFSSCESARTFLRNATGRLRQGGLLLITTVDSCAIGRLGRLARDAKDLVWQNGLLRVTFSDLQTLERIADEKEEYGLRYRFDLTGEGIDCEEFVVPEALMRGLLQELQVEVLAAMPFSDIALEDNLTAEQIATSILSRLPAGQASDVSVYDRLGLLLSREEAAIAALYKLFVCRKRQEPALTPEDAEEPSSHQAGDLLKGEPPVHVQ
ncbi:unnamed protein product [Effrenium voratum]|nr:unnamed protein product [Effrenium voratum]